MTLRILPQGTTEWIEVTCSLYAYSDAEKSIEIYSKERNRVGVFYIIGFYIKQ